MRELARTGSEAQDVVDAATWGAFEEGWRDAHGADADHLKTAADVDRCLAAGFTFFTIDPGDHVQGGADTMAAAHLEDAVRALPWEHLRDSRRDLVTRYAGRPVELGDRALRPSQEEVLRAAAKYGARFVTGATIPVDGGFSAYSGV
jgi:NAD(P)-dependent dehydrogenase (short-subunit alcohol dehydrogenase family)